MADFGLDALGAGLGNLFGGGQVFDIPGLSGSLPNIEMATPGIEAATAGTGAGGNWLSNLGGQIGTAFQNNPLQALGSAAGLGLTGMGIYGGIKGQQQAADQYKLLQKAQQFQQNAAQPSVAAGSALTQAGEQAMLGGPLPPQLESQVQQWGESARARLRDYFSKAGITDSSMMAQMESWIDEQMSNMREQMAGQLLGGGNASTATGLGGANSLAGTSSAQQFGQNNLMAQAQASLAQLTGSQRPAGA